MWSDVGKDLGYGFRTLRKNPGFAILSILTLTLGIGANSAIFSLIDGIILRPLPYKEPDRLVRLIQANKKIGLDTWGISQADYAAYRDQSKSFQGIALYVRNGVTLSGDGDPERIFVSNVTANFFDVLGVTPVIGRMFRAGEDVDGKNNLCVISNGFWLRRYGGDPGIIGKSLRLNGRETEIVGVAPAGFRFLRSDEEMWIPLALNPSRMHPYTYSSVARLRSGIHPQEAEAETTLILKNFGRAHPELGEGDGVDEPNGPRTLITPLKQVLVAATETPLLVLLVAVGMVLLIACANVANLLLARSTARTKEMAVRFAVGATPLRVARQLLTESLLLSSLGGVCGTLLAWLGISGLSRHPIAGIPRVDQVQIDAQVLVFTGAIAILTGLLFGLLPAARAYRTGLASTMRDGGRGLTAGGRWTGALVASQFAISLILLVGAGLLLKSFARLQAVEMGFNPRGVLTMKVSVPSSQPSSLFLQNLAAAARLIPGAHFAGVATNIPFARDGNEDNFLIEGQDNPASTSAEREQGEFQAVGRGTFQTLGIPLLSGRDFSDADNATAPPVAIIDETLARRYFPKGDALGRRIESGGDREWMTIVGIAGGVKQSSLAEEMAPHIYTSINQNTPPTAYLLVRTDGSPDLLVAPLRAAIRELNRDVPVYQIRPLDNLIEETLSSQRLTNLLLTSFSFVALALAAVGIYGTMSLYVGNRTAEFGIRVALGARPFGLMSAVLKEGFILASAGAAAGLIGSLALTRAMTTLLFQVSATDPQVFVAIPALLVVVAMMACYVPARRAARVDAMISIRG